MFSRANALHRWFDSDQGVRDHLISRWLFLRSLGLIYFSAFFSLLFQIRGLIGPRGILPSGEYLADVARSLGALRLWYAPTLLWISASGHALSALCWIGLLASTLVALNLWPRVSLAVCFVCFLSFVSAAGDFSSYQSDGMLLEAGFLALFLVPGGLLPGWGAARLSPRAAHFLLLWEWFRIYFQSGVVKLLSGDPTWRNLTAMYEYYQNGPLPTWVGWYLQQLPHRFHIATAAATLLMELALVFLAFLPRPWRIGCFFLVTFWQAGVILTANYAFLNYLVLVLAFLLLDDRSLSRFVPRRWRLRSFSPAIAGSSEVDTFHQPLRSSAFGTLRVAATAILLSWIFYATVVPVVRMFWCAAPLPTGPVAALEPFRIANQYGLFAVMTPHRYEIEFQGSDDGQQWVAYSFRYKPQDPAARPRIYAPYQPRFDWNLWFASLGSWAEYPIVPRTEERLLTGNPEVLGLFSGDPFPHSPPRYIRAVLWQYWFSTAAEHRARGLWWRRELLGTYAPTLTLAPDGHIAVTARATLTGPPAP